MSGVEAAASLFGSDEPGSDPFATLGADPAAHSSTDDLFSGDGVSSDSGFLTTSQNDSPFTATENQPQDTQLYSLPESNPGYTITSAYNPPAPPNSSQQGWYDHHGRWQSYEHQQQQHETPNSIVRTCLVPAVLHDSQLTRVLKLHQRATAPKSNVLELGICTTLTLQLRHNHLTTPTLRNLLTITFLYNHRYRQPQVTAHIFILLPRSKPHYTLTELKQRN